MVNCGLNKKKLSLSREIAYIAVTCALLIGGQFVFSFVVGVEIVTIILMSFSFVFGARRGAVCAVAFSLLRCFIFGFYPTALILYLIYYPSLAAVSGLLGRQKNFASSGSAIAVNALLATVMVSCAVCYFADIIKVAKVYAVTVKVLLWVIFALCAGLCAVYDFVYFSKAKAKNETFKVVFMASVGAVMTALFTLLDDVITPLFFGYSHLTALAYFYSSFTAMLPQIVCTVVSVCTLFLPLTAVLERAAKFNK